MIELETLNWSFQLLFYIYDMLSGMSLSLIHILDQDISCMEKGYETRIGENGKNLSGGQRQRLSIARALVKNPDIIIFDEGTGQLDAITEKEIYKELKNNNITQIIVTHRLSTIKDADYIYLIEQGEIVEQGMHKDLIETEGMYAKMWKEQN